MKLSKTQSALLLKMRAGESLHYMEYAGSFNPTPYYFCGMKRCTAAASALIEKGLVKKFGPPYRPEFRLTELGKTLQVKP